MSSAMSWTDSNGSRLSFLGIEYKALVLCHWKFTWRLSIWDRDRWGGLELVWNRYWSITAEIDQGKLRFVCVSLVILPLLLWAINKCLFIFTSCRKIVQFWYFIGSKANSLEMSPAHICCQGMAYIMVFNFFPFKLPEIWTSVLNCWTVCLSIGISFSRETDVPVNTFCLSKRWIFALVKTE